MGFLDDNTCNTGLVLGLGFTSSTSSPKSKTLLGLTLPANHEPSLTLSLSGGETYTKKTMEDANHHHELIRQGSNNSHNSHSTGVSSFSTVKRERDLSSEQEIEDVEKVSSRIVSDEDEDGGVNARKKLRLTKQQSALLEDSFKQHSTLNPKQKQALARQLNLRARQVEVWFQNRRARTKLKQTELDYELMKKCCETLTEENRRLQKELQELKSLKMAQPFYMHMPAATLTMCPSCERIGSGRGGGGSGGESGGSGEGNTKNNTPFKPIFFSPFTSHSAAC